MRRLEHLEGCAPRCYARLPGHDIEALRCYGGGSSSSGTTTTTNYEQATLDTGGAAGVNVGSGATTGAINITSGDVQTAQMALSGASNLAGQAIVTSAEQSEAADDIVANVANNAINSGAATQQTVANIAAQAIQTGAATAQSLGGAAINSGTILGTAALQYGQNITSLNLNALNQNTALAFSTIAALDTAQASGATSGAVQDLTDALARTASGSGGSTAAPVYIETTQPAYTGQTATSSISGGTIALILVGIAALIFGPKLLKA